MPTIHDAYINALLADASYVDGLTNATLEATLTGRMTPELATYIARNFELVTQVGGLSSSFDAAVWKDKTNGETYISIRGTQDFPMDFHQDGDLASSGVPHRQLADMVNWWLRATTTGEAPQIAVSRIVIPGLPIALEEFVQAPSVQGTGELASVGAIRSVNGHSLGGYLATAFVRLFGNQWPVASINTFNSAGFSRLAANNIESNFNQIAQLIGSTFGFSAFPNSQTNYFGENGLNAATNTWNPIGFQQYGTRVGLFQEDLASLLSITAPFFNNHSIYKLTDLLALGDALEQLDRTMSLEKLSRLVSAGSNRMMASYESVLDVLRRLFLGSNVQPTLIGDASETNVGPQPASRLDYHIKLRGLVESTVFSNAATSNDVTIYELSGLRASELFARANGENGLAYRYALRELNPFAVLGPDLIYAVHDTTLLAAYDAATRSGVLTDPWLHDRIRFLQARVTGNLLDQASIVVADQIDNWRYIDPAANAEIIAFGSAPTSIRRYAVFGSDGADKVEGASQADRLYAGNGTDYIVGRGGNDYEEGGRGLDVYQFNAGQRVTLSGIVTESDGQDEIRDIDGLGLLRYVYAPALGSAQSAVIVDTSTKISESTWQSADGKFSYAKQDADLVITINGNGGGSITLRDFRDGDFGIYLWDSRSEPLTERTLEGDLRPVEPTVYDLWGNVARTGDPSVDREDGLYGRDDDVGDLLIGGGGADLLLGDTPAQSAPGPRFGFDPLQSGGADRLQGDSGRDIIDAGPGDDLVEGGFGGSAQGDAGGDLIQGGLGDDALYGDFRTDLGAAIRNGETDAPSSLKGDFISGGAGKDWIVGSTANDLLMGGGEADVVIGGAGDDTIFSDDGVIATTFAWTANRTEPQPGGPNVYDVNVVGGNFVDFSAGGADVIYGGGGRDWVWSQVGNDFIDGGSGDDVLFGGYGSDVVLGAAGSDVLVGDEGIEDAAEGGDYLDGGDGDDTLYGNGGDDILVGGRGNDRLVGGPGKDIYIYEKGDGRDTIDDADTAGSASSVLHFGAGFARADVRFGLGSLKIGFGGDDQLHVEGFDPIDPFSTPVIGELRFDDGEVMTYADILAQGFDIDGTEENDDAHDAEHAQLVGTGVSDRIRGLGGNDVLAGLRGEDVLNGGAGADELQGGEGDDLLMGDGADTALANQGADRLFGEVGNDTLMGDGGNDELHGGDGDDLLSGGAGGDLLEGDAGSDRIFGGAGADAVLGGAGDDFVSGGDGNDQLSGDDGADEVVGGGGDDLAYGGGGADNVAGGAGNDTLLGETGDDALFGGTGSDLYLFNVGDGEDYIEDTSGADRVRFGEGITPGSLTVTRTDPAISSGFVFINYGLDDALTVKNSASTNTIQNFDFADGSTRTLEQLLATAQVASPGREYALYGTPVDDSISVPNLGNFRVYAGGGNDFVQGAAGDDRIDGGGGDDTLTGRAGNNVYVFARGSGRDRIQNAFSGGNDTLEFAADILAADVAFTREPNGDLTIAVGGGSDWVTVQGFYLAGGSHLEQIVYGDGSRQEMNALAGLERLPISPDAEGVLIGTQYDDTLIGDDGANVLDGREGYDRVEGGLGTDAYLLRAGMRRDVVVETDGAENILRLAPGLGFADLRAAQEGSDLFLSIRGTADGVVLEGYYGATQEWEIETASGVRKSLPVLLDELAEPPAGASVQQLRDAWVVQTNQHFYSILAPGHSQVDADLSLQVNGAFQTYYTVREYFTANNSSTGYITNGQWYDIGSLADFGIAAQFRTVTEVRLGQLGLEGAAGTGGSGFTDSFLVDYERTDATGNPFVVGIPDGFGSWTGDFLNLSTIQSASSAGGAMPTGDAAPTISVSVQQTNSIKGVRLENMSGGDANNFYAVFGVVAIDAGGGDDVLNAMGWVYQWGTPYGGDFLYGNSGNDLIFGSDDADLLIGGSGNDYLAGSGGHDTYHVIAQDTGRKIIDEAVTHYGLQQYFITGKNPNAGTISTDVVEFSDGIALEDLELGWGQFDSTAVDTTGEGKPYRVLTMSWAPGSELQVVMPDRDDPKVLSDLAAYAGKSWGIEYFRFADGTTLSMDEMAARVPTSVLEVNGTPGADSLAGTAGNDRLSGGAGNDVLHGGFGDDVYAFDPGGGADTIIDLGGNDAVVFGAGITPDMLSLGAGSLLVRIGGDGDALHIEGFDPGNALQTGRIESYRFADGTALTHAQLLARGFDLLGDDAAQTLTGTNVADRLHGFGGDDTLAGGAGPDALGGGPGNDVYVLDDADTVTESAGEGIDLVQSSVAFALPDNVENLTLTGWGSIVATGNGLNNIITSNDGGSALYGLDGDDTLIGANAADILDGGAGADRMVGREGNDTYYVDNPADLVSESGGGGIDLVLSSITYTLPILVENLTLTGTADINGTGNSFANILAGNSGINILAGLSGNDTYIISDAADIVLENSGAGTDSVQSGVTYTLPNNVENLTLTGTADINGTGNILANTITGNSGVNVLAGLGGNDTYDVSNTRDVIIENPGEGADLVRSTVTYTLPANVENLLLLGTANINGTGNDLANFIGGSSGRNLLSGGAGADSMAGNAGNDTYVVDNVGDTVTEFFNQGWDAVQSSISYALGANVENLTLTGADDINGTGNSLPNVIVGNGGDNVLDGDAADDVLTGGEGSDSYRFGIGYGPDTIVETDVQGDDTDSLLFGSGITTANLRGTRSGEDLRLTVDGATDRLTLKDWFASAGGRVEQARFADGTVWGAMKLQALAGGSNNPPVAASPIADQWANEDAPFGFGFPADTFTDPDASDTLSYAAAVADGSALPAWLSFDASARTFSGTPLNVDVGSIDLMVTASDNAGESASTVFRLTVANTNDAPTVANAIADQSATEDSPFSFTLPANTFADVDVGDSLAYSAMRADGSLLPSWLGFDPSSGAFSGSPGNSDVGSLDVQVTATDASGVSVSDVFALAVANTNDAPTVGTPISDQAATEDSAFVFTLPANTFVDIDLGDTLVYSAARADGSALPSWLAFDPSALAFSGTPANSDVGTVDVSVLATDAAGASAAASFVLSVANVNDAPVLANAIADQFVEAGMTLNISVPASTFVDVDADDMLTVSASSIGGGALPSWLEFDAATALFSGTPGASDIGVSGVELRATDRAGAYALADFALIVTVPAGTRVNGSAGADVVFGGGGNETLAGGGGADGLFGRAGDDILRGGTGDDVLQGGEGADVLHAGTGNNVLDGGSGSDVIFDGAGDNFIAGGAGADIIRLNAGRDVLAYNRGDGSDTIIGGGEGGNTLSLGGGIRYSDLSLSRSGRDLIIDTGGDDRLVFRDWYEGSQSLLTLQMITDASEDFDASSSDPLRDNRVETFDFLGLVRAFDQAQAQSPGLTSWALTNALLQFHLAGSDDAALGGDLAYWYARRGSLAGLSLQAAQQVIGAAGFGADAQQLRPFSGLQDGLVKLV